MEREQIDEHERTEKGWGREGKYYSLLFKAQLNQS